MQIYGTSDALETVGETKRGKQAIWQEKSNERTNERAGAGGRMKANERPNGKFIIMGYNKIEKSLISSFSKRMKCSNNRGFYSVMA